MECPSCGLNVLVQDGAVTDHLRPDTLESCNGKATKSSPQESKTDKAKSPTKSASKSKG